MDLYDLLKSDTAKFTNEDAVWKHAEDQSKQGDRKLRLPWLRNKSCLLQYRFPPRPKRNDTPFLFRLAFVQVYHSG